MTLRERLEEINARPDSANPNAVLIDYFFVARDAVAETERLRAALREIASCGSAASPHIARRALKGLECARNGSVDADEMVRLTSEVDRLRSALEDCCCSHPERGGRCNGNSAACTARRALEGGE